MRVFMPANADSTGLVRVLVADDEPRILDLFVEILAPEEEDLLAGLDGLSPLPPEPEPQFLLTLCHQGEEAVAAVSEALREGRPYAVAFLDVRMPPGRGGLAAAEAIRAIDPWIQIVMRLRLRDLGPDERPRSDTAPFSEVWSAERHDMGFIRATIDRWRRQIRSPASL